MAGFSFNWPSVSVGGEVGGFDVDVIWTPSAGGGWNPTVIPRSGGSPAVIPSTANQMMLLGAAIIGLLLLVLLLKR